MGLKYLPERDQAIQLAEHEKDELYHIWVLKGTGVRDFQNQERFKSPFLYICQRL